MNFKFACCGGGDYYATQRNLVIDLDGALVVPKYQSVPRVASRLLSLAWERRWDELVHRCRTSPNEAFRRTETGLRTALHLATFNEGCPMHVAVALLTANRHAILVEDRNCYTPLHNLGLFEGGDDLVPLFCDTAIMVEQELRGRGKLPTLSRTSPLYLAAKRDAPLSTLRILLQTRARSRWIAPFTGGEPYWDPQQTLDNFSSPLEILLRGRSACFSGISQETKQQMTAMALTLGSDQVLVPETMDERDHKSFDTWAKCLLLLKENVRTVSCSNTATPSLLHTVASLKVPSPILVKIALELFPGQLVQRDDTGNHPLCHLLKSNHPYATKQLISILMQSPSTIPDGTEKSLNMESQTNFPLSFIQEGLKVCLETRLKWEDGLKDIVMANSEVLLLEDPETRLVPAFLAANQNGSLDTIFLLLQAEPHVITTKGFF